MHLDKRNVIIHVFNVILMYRVKTAIKIRTRSDDDLIPKRIVYAVSFKLKRNVELE